MYPCAEEEVSGSGFGRLPKGPERLPSKPSSAAWKANQRGKVMGGFSHKQRQKNKYYYHMTDMLGDYVVTDLAVG